MTTFDRSPKGKEIDPDDVAKMVKEALRHAVSDKGFMVKAGKEVGIKQEVSRWGGSCLLLVDLRLRHPVSVFIENLVACQLWALRLDIVLGRVAPSVTWYGASSARIVLLFVSS